MSINEKLTKIRAYALTAKTAIYNEDAMTAIELAGQTACKVNECVEAINMVIDIVDDLAQLVKTLHYDAVTEELTIG